MQTNPRSFLKQTRRLLAGVALCALPFVPLGTEAGAFALDGPTENTAPVHIPFDSFTLENGLRVVVHEDRKAPIVAVSVWYHVGSKDEPEGKTGFAHLFEHLMYNGSENYDDEFFGPLEKVGATAMNGTTWFDRTNYFQNVPTPALDLALWMESDRMGHLLGAVTQDKLDEQRGVVQNEKRQGDNQAFGKVEYRQLEGLFPPGHPYRHSTIGSMADLDAASLEDVKNWFRQYYGASNAILVLAGDIDAATAKSLAEKYFGDIAAGPSLTKHKVWVPVKTASVREEMIDSVPNERLYRTWPVAARTQKDAYILHLASGVMGQGKNSRLYKALVHEAGLASNVSVSVQQLELASLFEVQIDLLPGKEMAKAEAILDRELAKFLKEGPTTEELSRIKTSVKAARIRELEEIGGFGGKATALAQGALYAGDPGFYQTALGWMENASVQSVRRTADHWLTKGYHQLHVKPVAEYATTEGGADRSKLPDVAGLPALDFPEVAEAVLDNGMKLFVANRPSVPLVNVAVQFDGGYAADQGGLLGGSSVALAMLEEGTAKLDAFEVSARFEALGAEFATSSNLDTSTVHLSALKENFEDSIKLYADVMRNPAFRETDLEKLKTRWIARIEREKASPIQLGLRTLPPLLYGEGHAYSVPLTGSGNKGDVEALTPSYLKALHEQTVRSDNGQIFVVGDITLAQALPVLNKAFGKWQAPKSEKRVKNLVNVPVSDTSRVVIMHKPGAVQSLILAGHLVPSTAAPDALALETANDILGGQFTARVNMNLREDKGWAYGAYTFTRDARGQRPWLVYAPVQTDKTKQSIMELNKEFTAYLGDSPATATELAASVANRSNSLPGQFETGGAVLQAMLSNSRFGRPLDYEEGLPDAIKALSRADLQKAAASYIKPGSLVWLIVGDREKIEADVRSLDLGPLEVWSLDGERLE